MSFSIITSLIQLASHTSKITSFKQPYPNCKIALQITTLILSSLTAIGCIIAGVIMGSLAITVPGITLVVCLMSGLIIANFKNRKKQIDLPLTQNRGSPTLSQELSEMNSSTNTLYFPNTEPHSIITTDNTLSRNVPFDPKNISLIDSQINPKYWVFAQDNLSKLQTQLYEEWGLEVFYKTSLTIRNLKNGIRLTFAPISLKKQPFDTSLIDNISPNKTFQEGFLYLICRWTNLPESPFRFSYEPDFDNPFIPNAPCLSENEYLKIMKTRFSLTFQKIEENNFSHIQMPLINKNCFISYNSYIHTSWISACHQLLLDSIANLSAASSIKHIILVGHHEPVQVPNLAAIFCREINSKANTNEEKKTTTYLILKSSI